MNVMPAWSWDAKHQGWWDGDYFFSGKRDVGNVYVQFSCYSGTDDITVHTLLYFIFSIVLFRDEGYS